ncbi:retrovirus-related pol polyprotein from transposon TNT 1-94, partial [Tanacetum coccineum]
MLNSRKKVFVITTLKNDLRKFKGKEIVDNVAQVLNATTIAPGMYKLDPIVEQSKSLNNLDSASYSACKYIKLIQELLGYVRDTCPDIHKPSEKLVAVTPINKKKTSSSMFDARHELCFLEFVYDMNARRTFTLVRNVCPLTRITATNKVPLREPIPLEVIAQESVVTKVYTRRPKVKFLASKDEAPDFIIKFLKMIQVRLNTPVRNIRIDNGTEFVNQTMRSYYESVGPGLHLMTPATSSSGLVSKPIPQLPCNPPKRDDWDRLLQPIFDEYFNPLIFVVSLVPVVAAPRAIDL